MIFSKLAKSPVCLIIGFGVIGALSAVYYEYRSGSNPANMHCWIIVGGICGMLIGGILTWNDSTRKRLQEIAKTKRQVIMRMQSMTERVGVMTNSSPGGMSDLLHSVTGRFFGLDDIVFEEHTGNCWFFIRDGGEFATSRVLHLTGIEEIDYADIEHAGPFDISDIAVSHEHGLIEILGSVPLNLEFSVAKRWSMEVFAEPDDHSA